MDAVNFVLTPPETMVEEEKETQYLLLMGDIGGFYGVTQDDLLAALKNSQNLKELHVGLVSPGGSIWDAMTMYNLIKAHPAKTKVHILGFCASAATYLACAFDEVSISRSALYMIHKAESGAWGNSDVLKHEAQVLEQHDKVLVDIYAQKTGLEPATIKRLMKKEGWLEPKEALELGFVDEVVDEITLEYDAELVGRYMGNDFYYWDHQAQTNDFKNRLVSKGLSPLNKSFINQITMEKTTNKGLWNTVVKPVLAKFGISLEGKDEEALAAEVEKNVQNHQSKGIQAAVTEQLGNMVEPLALAVKALLENDPQNSQRMLQLNQEALKGVFNSQFDARKAEWDQEKAGLVKEINNLKLMKSGGGDPNANGSLGNLLPGTQPQTPANIESKLAQVQALEDEGKLPEGYTAQMKKGMMGQGTQQGTQE